MSRHWLPGKTERQAAGDLDDVTDETRLVTSRLHDETREEPLVQPIVHSSTYRIQNVKHYEDILKQGGRLYLRLGNSTCESVEATVNELEGGAGSIVFGCGMAAISTALLTLLHSGDHIVCCHPLYSGTYDVMTKQLQERYNIAITFVDYDIEEYRKAIRPNTKVLFGETPCNPLLSILDVEELAKLGRSQPGLTTILDTTYATPYLLKPIKYGIDIVIHSGTKYLGGHSDLCAGIATARTVDQWKELMIGRRTYGGILSPFEASLLMRGLKTLHLRVDRQCNTAAQLAQLLECHVKVKEVYYPGLKSNPGHEIAKRQMKKFGAMIGFELKGGLEAAKTFVQSVRVITLAVSLGGVESLVEHPATMTHGTMIMTDQERKEGHIADGLIRFSVGLEDVDDLTKDIQQALDKIN
jgi:cystathionine beta-lyase/cystathionine gamma-synthase